jgi:hypothetical protein
MGYAKPSRTEELYTEAQVGPNGRVVVDSLGLIHWLQARSSSDSRPWTNSHLTHVLARSLRTLEGPTWAELFKLSHRIGGRPRQLLPFEIDEGCITPGYCAVGDGGNWGWKLQTWRYGNDPQTTFRHSVAMARLDPLGNEGNGKVQRRNLRDTTPAEVLTWAARIGILGNIEVRFQSGTRVKTGEVGREQLVEL